MSENDLLEMADDFKKRIELKNKEIKKLKHKLIEARKDFLFAYGEIRNIDIIINDDETPECWNEEIVDLIGTLGAKLNHLVESYLLADVGGYDSD